MDSRHGRSASVSLAKSSKGFLVDTNKKAAITTKVTELVLHSKTNEDDTIMTIPTSPIAALPPLQRSISGRLFKSSLKRHGSVNDASAFLGESSFNTFGVSSVQRPGPRRRNASVSDMFNHFASSIGAKSASEPDLALPTRRYSAEMLDYEVDILIGYGATATVHLARYLPTNEQVAIKMVDMDMFAPRQIDELRSCHDILQAHSNGLEESVIRSILKQVLDGLYYLHCNNLIHRDVKAANLLVDRTTGNVKLADFGVSAVLTLPEAQPPSILLNGRSPGTRRRATRHSFVGTPCWMSPEILESKGYDCKVDMWSLGITALELAHGRPPNSYSDPANIFKSIVLSAPPSLDEDKCEHTYSDDFKDFIKSCLVKDPNERISSASALNHPFFRKAFAPPIIVQYLRDTCYERRRRRYNNTTTSAPPSGDETFGAWDFPPVIDTSIPKICINEPESDVPELFDSPSESPITPADDPPPYALYGQSHSVNTKVRSERFASPYHSFVYDRKP
ncbi:hypothetical protein INT43_007568 [Umbelopsis isabellina]|uniref:Protein kinase domain-containing protein n=1 Tax=Mortierella isabellina TaxID=91625 RepID=A0A8H7PNZ7_MORIS|nr:hypothetical protein INT43_007568 [Umbelopsis isabellina]